MTKNINTQEALLIIPDISGFTNFMNGTKLKYAAQVISSLLEKLMDLNMMGLKVNEIEGDAIIFYRLGNPPSPKAIIDQCQLFFDGFNQEIEKLYHLMKAEGEEDNTLLNLGLKVVVNFGTVSLTPIGKKISLLGEPVVTAHKLLKNSIEEDEYVLFSDKYLEACVEHIDSSEIPSNLIGGADFYENLGEITYSYLPLSKVIQYSKTGS